MASSDQRVNLDLTAVAVNEFIQTTSEFLNSFATICEAKLIQMNNRLFELETSLSLIETKMDSVQQEPYYNKGTEFQQKLMGKLSPSMPDSTGDAPKKEERAPDTSTLSSQQEISSSQMSGMMWKDHPTYAPFFRQLKFGVPIDAIKAKLSLSGLDPSVIENDPSSLVPPSFV